MNELDEIKNKLCLSKERKGILLFVVLFLLINCIYGQNDKPLELELDKKNLGYPQAADFNNDGFTDLVYFRPVKGGKWYNNWAEINVYLNNKAGGLLPKKTAGIYRTFVLESSFILTVDFNGDKNIDILVGSAIGDNLFYYEGDGTGNFKNKTKF